LFVLAGKLWNDVSHDDERESNNWSVLFLYGGALGMPGMGKKWKDLGLLRGNNSSASRSRVSGKRGAVTRKLASRAGDANLLRRHPQSALDA
jgi:hypothetical protein